MRVIYIAAGILLLLFAVTVIGVRYFAARKQGQFRAWGWGGLALIVLAEGLLFLRLSWVRTFFTPLVWTGYLLLVDAMVFRLRGASRLGSSPRGFFTLAFWSVPLWLIFETYNLRLENWTYVGVPVNPLVGGFGSAWAFATIWPAIYGTADLVKALGLVQREAKRRIVLSRSSHASILLLGLLMVAAPVLLPARLGQYLFGAVWVGFALLLEPLNYRWNGRSLLRDWETGQTATFYSFLVSGLICGVLWEFWNYWAGAKWLYIFPIGQGAKVFEMPLPGYFGFPPFALECFAMYEFLVILGKRLSGLRRSPRWQAAGSEL